MSKPTGQQFTPFATNCRFRSGTVLEQANGRVTWHTDARQAHGFAGTLRQIELYELITGLLKPHFR